MSEDIPKNFKEYYKGLEYRLAELEKKIKTEFDNHWNIDHISVNLRIEKLEAWKKDAIGSDNVWMAETQKEILELKLILIEYGKAIGHYHEGEQQEINKILKQLNGEIEGLSSQSIPFKRRDGNADNNNSKPSREIETEFVDVGLTKIPDWMRKPKEKPSEPSDFPEPKYISLEEHHNFLRLQRKELISEFLPHLDWCLNELYPTHFNEENYKRTKDYYFELKKRSEK